MKVGAMKDKGSWVTGFYPKDIRSRFNAARMYLMWALSNKA
jgi:hypothetical protein